MTTLQSPAETVEPRFDANGQFVKVMACTPQVILGAVADYYGKTPKQLMGRSRFKSTVLARHVAIWLMREMTHWSLDEIGVLLGRDHTTIMNSERAIDRKLRAGDDAAKLLRARIDAIERRVRGGSVKSLTPPAQQEVAWRG